MNILYCGDKNIEDGLIISVLSILKQCKRKICVYVLTMESEEGELSLKPVSDKTIGYLDEVVKKHNPDGFVKKIDTTSLFYTEKPSANLKTRFTPCCMLRLYADQIEELPDKILYLDNDVICRSDISEFYDYDISSYELAGVLDYYGSWFFRNNIFKRDYINSGVLLLNLKKIRQTGLFNKCRQRCRSTEMFMPDQSAINKLAVNKKIMPRRFNEQRHLRKDTVMQHFTTSFRFFPWFRTVCVKPWDIDRMHSVLKLHEYDELLNEYQHILADIK